MANPTTEYLAVPATEELIWKEVNLPGLSRAYTVSRYGGVRSPKGKLLNASQQSNQLWVSITKETGGTTSARVDKLVLSAFDRYEPLMAPEHKDGDTTNCALDNLVWREPTPSELAPLMVALERNQGLRKTKTGRPKTTKSANSKAGKVTLDAKPIAGRVPPALPPIEVLRTYRLGEVSVSTTPDGGITELPTPPLTPTQASALIRIMAELATMNIVMGVK